MENKDENTKERETNYLEKVKQKVSSYANNTVQGLREETVGVLKDFSTKEALLENSKKMHHLRVFAMVFIIFTVLLTLISMVFTVLNGLSCGHDIEDLHFGASFHAGSIAFAVASIIISFIYLRQAYRNKSYVWIPALLIPGTTLFFLRYVSQSLSWYGMGADVAQGCANFAAIVSLPPLFLELTVTGHMQKFGNLIKKFFLWLHGEKIHMLRIIAIATGLTVILIKIIELIYIGMSDQLFYATQNLTIGTFVAIVLIEALYLRMSWKNSPITFICPILFTLLVFGPSVYALIKEYPVAEELNYTAVTLSGVTIILEFIARHLLKKN